MTDLENMKFWYDTMQYGRRSYLPDFSCLTEGQMKEVVKGWNRAKRLTNELLSNPDRTARSIYLLNRP